MNERDLRPGNVAAAAMVIGGLLSVLWPQHGVGIARLVIVTVAVAAGLYALAVNVPEWSTVLTRSPFDRTDLPASERRAAGEIDRIRSQLARRRQRIEGGPAVPPEVLRLLKPLIVAALERQGLDLDDEAQLESARDLLSAPTWAVLTADVLEWPSWFRTVRPDERAVADVVHGVLDDVDRLTVAGTDPQRHIDPRYPRAVT